jgi:hypothetical protein
VSEGQGRSEVEPEALGIKDFQPSRRTVSLRDSEVTIRIERIAMSVLKGRGLQGRSAIVMAGARGIDASIARTLRGSGQEAKNHGLITVRLGYPGQHDHDECQPTELLRSGHRTAVRSRLFERAGV